jgi:hypothetical protein
MSGQSFLAIAPHGQFDVEALEIITAAGGQALVRIILGGRALAIRVPAVVLQDHVAQLRPQQPVIQSVACRVLFSPGLATEVEPLPGPENEASGVASDDAASSPAAAATAIPPRVTPGDLAHIGRRIAYLPGADHPSRG